MLQWEILIFYTKMNNRQKCLEEFNRLLDIMDELREKCPWDKKQNNDTLRMLTIEETYELADAISSKDDPAICGELGDILLHIVFYAKLGDEKGAFNMTDVINGICNKLIYRHPHVFGDIKVSSAKEVLQNWEELKTHEKKGYKRVLSGVPSSLPAIVKAYRIQEKVSGVGFDWEKPEQVWDKVEEEKEELTTEIQKGDKERIKAEFGDLFFALVNAARLYNIDPEAAIDTTNREFIRRFNYIESKTLEQNKTLKEMTLGEMEELWQEAKHDKCN